MRHETRTRTKFLALCARHPAFAATVILLLGLILAIDAIGFVQGRATPPKRSAIVYPFDPFPEGFEARTAGYSARDYCYLVVHPGYMTYTDMGEGEALDPSVYGDYSSYLHSLNSFVRELRARDEIVIFGLEERTAEDLEFLPDGLRPWRTVPLIVTRNHSGLPQTSLTDEDGTRRSQDLGRIMDFLRVNGIEEIRVAGEAAWFVGPNGHRGCLATLASAFADQGFRIRGVRGCVYPTVSLPPEEYLGKCFKRDQWLKDRWQGLYGDKPLQRMTQDPVLRAIYGHSSASKAA